MSESPATLLARQHPYQQRPHDTNLHNGERDCPFTTDAPTTGEMAATTIQVTSDLWTESNFLSTLLCPSYTQEWYFPLADRIASTLHDDIKPNCTFTLTNSCTKYTIKIRKLPVVASPYGSDMNCHRYYNIPHRSMINKRTCHIRPSSIPFNSVGTHSRYLFL